MVKGVAIKGSVTKKVVRPMNSTAGILERTAYQVNDLFVNLAQKPEVAIFLVFALVASISNQTAGTGSDIMSEMVAKLKEIDALKSVAELLGKYKKQTVAILWFAGVYGAVPTRSRTMVIIAAMITILALDYSMVQSGVVAMAVYLFFSVKDKQVRIVAILVALGYTYITYFQKTDAASSPLKSGGGR